MAENLGDAILVLRTDSKKFNTGISQAEKRTKSLNKFFVRAGLSLAGLGIGLKKFVEIADTMSLIESRLKLVTDSQEQLVELQEDLLKVSNETRVSLEATSNLYARFGRATKDLNVDQEELVDVIRTINQAIIVSGATAQEAAAGLIQLSQGLASNTLRGDELRSVSEQLPRVFRAIADSLGVSIGKLREMAMQGAITADTVIKAFKDQAGVIQEEFEKVDKTAGQSFIVLKNNILDFISEFNKGTRATEGVSKVIDKASSAVENVGGGVLEWIKILNDFDILLQDVIKKTVGLETSAEAELRVLKEQTLELKRQALLRQIKDDPFSVILNGDTRDITNALNEIQNKTESTFAKMIIATNEWADTLADQLTDLVFDADKSFGDILKSFVRMLVKMQFQLNIVDPLKKFLGGKFAQITGSLITGGGSSFASGAAGLIPISANDSGRGSMFEVNVIGAPEGTRTQERDTPNGGRSIDVIIDEEVAQNIARQGSRTNMAISRTFQDTNNQLIRR